MTAGGINLELSQPVAMNYFVHKPSVVALKQKYEFLLDKKVDTNNFSHFALRTPLLFLYKLKGAGFFPLFVKLILGKISFVNRVPQG